MQALFQDCESDENCQTAYPDLELDFNQVLDALGENGIEVTQNDATSGEEITYLLTQSTFVNAIRGILYTPQFSRLIPTIIEQGKAGDFRALSAILDALGGDVGISIGAQMTILCAEDYPRMSSQEIRSEAGNGFVADSFIEVFLNGCNVWPQAPLPEIYSQDLTSEIPTLILSGDIDPVTPPRWGNRMAEVMSNSLHLVAPNTGHNVAPIGCAPDLMAQFVNEGTIDNIDGSCLDEIRRPSFFVNSSGPIPPSNDTNDSLETNND